MDRFLNEPNFEGRKAPIQSWRRRPRNVLHKKDFAFLRAFCWISLPDYVMFEYDLPKQCNDPEMLHVIELTKKEPIEWTKKEPIV